MIEIETKKIPPVKELQDRLMRVNRLHRCACDAMVKQTGLHRSQHRMLFHLYLCKSERSQKAIAERFDISCAAVATTLKKLESDGLIKRSCSKEDNRYNEIEITDKGKEIIEFSKNAFDTIDEATFKDLSDDEKLYLADLLDKLAGNLKAIGKE